MPITKASGQAVAPAAKGDLVVGSATNDAAVLAVGSTDQVLTVDSSTTTGLKWAAASSGGMTLISTTTISNNASIVLSSIAGTYNQLRLVLQNVQATNYGDEVRLRFNADTNSRYAQTQYLDTNGFNRTFSQTSFNIQPSGSYSSETALVIVDIPFYANTSTWKISNTFGISKNAATTTNANYYGAICAYNQTSAITSLTIFGSTGNLSSGTILLYGVK